MPPDLNVQKIAVLRANAFGDFLFVLPAIHALRTTFPMAEIVLLGKDWHAEFVPDHVLEIDRVVAVPRYPGVGATEDASVDTKHVKDFFAQMRAEEFDLAFQMHGGGRHSNRFVRRLGAKWTVGSATPDAPKLDDTVPYMFYQNEVLRYLELAARVGATTDQIMPHVVTTEADKEEARQQIGGGNDYIVIHPGATDPRRRWPIPKFAAVANAYLKRGFRVFITGSEDERLITEEVSALTDYEAVDISGTLSLGGLAGLLAGARLLASNDTGPLHLARTVGCPTVGIYWVGNFITAGPMRHAQHLSLLSWRTQCPVCKEPCVPLSAKGCEHNESFVDDVTIKEVLEAAEQLL
jgi:ADP-heptose:LPS heptosyltransferase